MIQVKQISIDDVTDGFFNELKKSFPDPNDNPDWDLEKTRAFMADRSNLFLIGLVDNHMAGYVYGLHLPRLDIKKKFLVYNVETGTKFRRQGVATAILIKLFEILRGSGTDSVWIPTDNDNNAAIGLYKKFGGKMTETDVSFVYDLKNGESK